MRLERKQSVPTNVDRSRDNIRKTFGVSVFCSIPGYTDNQPKEMNANANGPLMVPLGCGGEVPAGQTGMLPN